MFKLEIACLYRSKTNRVKRSESDILDTHCQTWSLGVQTMLSTSNQHAQKRNAKPVGKVIQPLVTVGFRLFNTTQLNRWHPRNIVGTCIMVNALSRASNS